MAMHVAMLCKWRTHLLMACYWRQREVNELWKLFLFHRKASAPS